MQRFRVVAGLGRRAGLVLRPQMLRSTLPAQTPAMFSSAAVTVRSVAACRRALISGCNARSLHSTAQLSRKIVSFPLADIGEGIAEVEILEWYVKEGDEVEEFTKLCQVQSDKATVDISSMYKGTVAKIYYKTHDVAFVGKPLVDIRISEADVPEALPPAPLEPEVADHLSPEGQSHIDASQGKYLMTPAVRRLVREHKLNMADIIPSGKNNRVTKEDIQNYLDGKQTKPKKAAPQAASLQEPISIVEPTPAAPAPAAVSIPEPVVRASTAPADRVEQIKGIKKAMVKSMTAALKVPHFGYADEIEMDNLIRLRESLKASVLEKHGVKLTFMPFFIKAASIALANYPILNSAVNEDGTEITYFGSHNVSIAMDTPQGLLVPNVKDVASKSILEIARDLNRLQELGKQGKLGPSELTGGTFTLSNIGNVGGTYLNPVLVVPQVAIGALGKTQRVPRFDKNDNVVATNIMNVSWSADHRVIDGVTMAKFSNEWKSFVEEPSRMLLSLK